MSVLSLPLRGGSTSSLSHFLELYGAASVAPIWFSIVLSLLLRRFLYSRKYRLLGKVQSVIKSTRSAISNTSGNVTDISKWRSIRTRLCYRHAWRGFELMRITKFWKANSWRVKEKKTENKSICRTATASLDIIPIYRSLHWFRWLSIIFFSRRKYDFITNFSLITLPINEFALWYEYTLFSSRCQGNEMQNYRNKQIYIYIHVYVYRYTICKYGFVWVNSICLYLYIRM